VEEVLAQFTNNSALRHWCNYEVDGKGIKRCARFLRKHYSVLREIIDQMNWDLTEERLNKKQKPLIGRWEYEDDCWGRREN